MKKFISILVTLSLLFGLSIYAYADNSTINLVDKENTRQLKLHKIVKNSDKYKVLLDKDGIFSFAPSDKANADMISQNSVNDKTASNTVDYIMPAKKAFLDELSSIGGQTLYTLYMQCSGADTSTKLNGSFFDIRFDTPVTFYNHVNELVDDSLTASGSSSARWLGSNPYYATKIDQSDIFEISYTGLSGYISVPLGAGVSPVFGGKATVLTYPTVDNNYHRENNYQNISGGGWIVNGFDQSSQSYFLFGTVTYCPYVHHHIDNSRGPLK